MKTRQNKYRYLVILQGNYGYGWDDLVTYDTANADWYNDLRADRKAYRENEPQYPHRTIHRRELNESNN